MSYRGSNKKLTFLLHETVVNMALESFYKLRSEVIEDFGKGLITEASVGEIMVSMAVIERELTANKNGPFVTTEELDVILYDKSTLKEKTVGPTKQMKQYANKERQDSAKRVDWIIGYGKLCTLRGEVAALEAKLREQRPESEIWSPPLPWHSL